MATKFRFDKNHWKEFNEEDLKVIEKEREENLKKLKAMNLGRRCPACLKPNSVAVDFCTGCEYPLTALDIIQLPKNVFLDIIEGRNTGTPILFRNEELCLFDDKFGVSLHHIDVIPIKVIPDITHLTKDHLPLIKNLYKFGLEEFMSRDNLEYMKPEEIEQNLVCGFNEPVSVKHVHLHMVLPPFKHEKVFQYPRWHSYKKVISDLEKYGKIKTYQEQPNDEEGKEEYDRAMRLHKKYEGKVKY